MKAILRQLLSPTGATAQEATQLFEWAYERVLPLPQPEAPLFPPDYGDGVVEADLHKVLAPLLLSHRIQQVLPSLGTANAPTHVMRVTIFRSSEPVDEYEGRSSKIKEAKKAAIKQAILDIVHDTIKYPVPPPRPRHAIYWATLGSVFATLIDVYLFTTPPAVCL